MGKVGDILFGILTGAPSPGRRKELLAERMEQERQGFLSRAMAEAEARQRYPEPVRPQGVPLGNGGFGEYTPGIGFKVLQAPIPDEPPAVRVARMAGLTPGTPEWKAALTASIPGYGYTAPAIEAKTQGQVAVANQRAANSAALKSQPTYAQRHPRASTGRTGKPAKLPTGFILD